MLFYKIDLTLIGENSLPASRDRDSFRTMTADYKEKSDSFYHKIKEQRFFFVSNTNNGHVVIGAISLGTLYYNHNSRDGQNHTHLRC